RRLVAGIAFRLALIRRRTSGLGRRCRRRARLVEIGIGQLAIGRAGGDFRACPLIGLALAPALDRHWEIDARDLFVVAKLSLRGLLGAAYLARLVDLDLKIGVGI